MMLINSGTIFQTVNALAIITVVIIVYYKWAFTYWEKKNVPGLKPSIPLGNFENPFTNKLNIGECFRNVYASGKALKNKYMGIYLITRPVFFIIDPLIMKYILQQDYDHFTDRGFYYNKKDDPLSANLLTLEGEEWRFLRTKLSPVFTAAKLKTMFETLLQCGYELSHAIDIIYAKKREIEITDVSKCYSMDVIGSCGFGVECNCLTHPNSKFRQEGRKIFSFDSGFRRAKIALAFAFPHLSRMLKLGFFDKDTTNFFINIVKETIKFRQTNNVIRKDILQLLIDLQKDSRGDSMENTEPDLFENEGKIKEIAANIFIFFTAGFETSSTTLSYGLYELAANPDVQSQLRNDINDTLIKHEGNVNYDSIMDMKYMDQVIEEILRKYPPASFLARKCVKDYKIPGTETILEKESGVVISLLGLHRDSDYYPEPEKFDPDRFSDDNKAKRLQFTYLPFGEGPKICIGLRFGLMQIKIALALLLKKYRFTLNAKTTEPIQFEPYSFTLIPKHGIYLNIEKIS